MTRWWPHLALLALTLCASAAVGSPREVLFRTMPGGAIVLDEAGHVVARAADAAESEYRFPLDMAVEHRYRLRRRRFVDLTLDLRWSPAAHGWEYRCDTASGYLDQATRFDFARAVHLNGVPPDVNVSMATTAARARTIVVGGVPHRVVPLRETADGRYVVPHAYVPPTLYLDGDGIVARALVLGRGQLDTDDDVVPAQPVALEPSPARLARRMAAIGAAVAAVLLLSAMLLRRRRRTSAALTPTVVTGVQGAEATLGPGAVVSTASGTFRLERVLGQGGMGVVYEALRLEPPDQRPAWAIKILTGEGERSVERFRREVEVCSRLLHPNIVKILDWGSIPTSGEPMPFLVMELVSGRTLRATLQDGRLPLAETLQLGEEVLKGLRAAHAAGVVHRDLKPENIMLTEGGRAKIMDFGIARKSTLSRLTSTQSLLGTPAYLSPEHFDAGTATAASDLFSFGIVLYEVLSGTHPWGLDRLEFDSMYVVLGRMLTMPPTPLAGLRPDLPPEVVAVVHRLIEADPAVRYATADEALADWTRAGACARGGPPAPTEA